jgi:glycosyltransferase involved in cell wall biosynthesis
MRIAIFHNLLSGGAKRTLCEMTRRLAGAHEVDAYAFSCSEQTFADIRPFVGRHHVVPFEPSRLLGSPFGRLNQALRIRDLQRLGRAAREVAARIDAGGYDVAFVHPCQFEQSSSVLRYLKRTPSVYYCQEPLRLLYESMPARPYDDQAVGRRRVLNRLDPLPAIYRRLLRARDRANTRAAGRVLVNSRFMADAVSRIYGVGAVVSYHGVDAGHFHPLALPRRDVVLSVGSLTPLKGFDFLIRAMAEYHGDARPALVIASNFQNPPERDYLTSLARDLGVELELRGLVTDEGLVELYNQARVVAYAPVREPFGLVPLEAMACGTPVVAVTEGGIPESIVDGQTGLLTDRDPARFAAAVERLVDDPRVRPPVRRRRARSRAPRVDVGSGRRAAGAAPRRGAARACLRAASARARAIVLVPRFCHACPTLSRSCRRRRCASARWTSACWGTPATRRS